MNSLILIFFLTILSGCIPPSSLPTTPPDTSSPPPPQDASKTPLGRWTEQVLSWNEGFKGRNQDDATDFTGKIDKNEFDQAFTAVWDLAVTGSIADANHWVGKKKPEDSFYEVKPTAYHGTDYYAQKIDIPRNSEIIVMGDFHGSIHSLMRNLWRLRAQGYLDDKFVLTKPNTYLVVTGDMVDRGGYGAEILYTLFQLKLKNSGNVFLLRGNHESYPISKKYGFRSELVFKYGEEEGQKLFEEIANFYRLLPVLLLTKTDGANSTILHFSHGGFSFSLNSNNFVHSPVALLQGKFSPFFEVLAEDQAKGYMWTDFHQDDASNVSSRGLGYFSSAIKAGKTTVEGYFSLIASAGVGNLVAIFRGHQDRGHGFKMFFKDHPGFDKLNEVKTDVYDVSGPFWWTKVVAPEVISKARSKEGMDLSPYRRVFTFTSATEGQSTEADSYGIIKVSDQLKDYRLVVHENLVTQLPDRQFLSIDITKKDDDGIKSSWSPTAPGRLISIP